MFYTKRPLFLFILTLQVAWWSTNSFAQDFASLKQEREAFAKDFAQTVITILHDVKTPYTHRKDILRQSFTSSVDTDWIAKFVLGHSWKQASDEQRERYTHLYRRFLTETYVTNFAENPEKSIENIKILGVADAPDDNTFIVHTHMGLTNNTNMKVDYLVSEEDKHYRVRDIVIENVSLITTHRAQFSALASAQGVDTVIHTLEDQLHHAEETKLSMK